MNKHIWFIIFLFIASYGIKQIKADNKTRVIVNTDGEVDDQNTLIRFLLYSDEFDVEGIVKTSSQYHAEDHNWAGDNWTTPYLNAYAQVYPNLLKHDTSYPTPDYLKSVTKLGNVKTVDDTSGETPGSQLIVNVLLDTTDNRPIWIISWGGENTIARALETIEETHPEKMAYVANKIRFYFIWEQDGTFQSYIRPHWERPYNIKTIISDQFITFGYWWTDWNMPTDMAQYFESTWMKNNLIDSSNPLLSLYHTNSDGSFMGEGDSPSFIYLINTGLRNDNLEHPNWGSWGGRYIKIRENTWLDSVPDPSYTYPSGRWYTSTAWGRSSLRNNSATDAQLKTYFKPIWRWIDAIQNDFAARAAWCVKPYSECNHPPVVKLQNALSLNAKPGSTINLSAKGTYDPDGNLISYKWWQYKIAETYKGNITISDSLNQDASFVIPEDATEGETIHIVCSVQDNGSPPITRYQRVIITVDSVNSTTGIEKPNSDNNYPKVFKLNQNYPNPFNPTTMIKYEVAKPSFVTIRLFNILGKEISTLVSGYKRQGTYSVNFNGSGLASGIYFVQMKAKSYYQSIKIVLMK